MRTVYLYGVCHSVRVAVRADSRVTVKEVARRGAGTRSRSTTAANYRNLRVFAALLRRGPGVSLPRAPIIRGPVPHLFAAIAATQRRARDARARKDPRTYVQARMRSPVRTGRTYIRRFPPGKFITRLIEYRRMRSEKYYV